MNAFRLFAVAAGFGESGQVDCVVYDPAVNNWPLAAGEWLGVMTRMTESGYQPVFPCGEVQVWQRSADRPCFRQAPPICPEFP